MDTAAESEDDESSTFFDWRMKYLSSRIEQEKDDQMF